jgi:hypothetical protein
MPRRLGASRLERQCWPNSRSPQGGAVEDQLRQLVVGVRGDWHRARGRAALVTSRAVGDPRNTTRPHVRPYEMARRPASGRSGHVQAASSTTSTGGLSASSSHTSSQP